MYFQQSGTKNLLILDSLPYILATARAALFTVQIPARAPLADQRNGITVLFQPASRSEGWKHYVSQWAGIPFVGSFRVDFFQTGKMRLFIHNKMVQA